MALETERKFLVRDGAWRQGAGNRISQGYLSRDPERTVRVRLAGEKAYITVKGKAAGATRAEFEYEIPPGDAEQLLALCAGPLIEKIRRRIPYAGLVWEVDEFFGDNAGLVVAEVELEREDQAVELPPWAGDEVTADKRYANSNLSERPYRSWKP